MKPIHFRGFIIAIGACIGLGLSAPIHAENVLPEADARHAQFFDDQDDLLSENAEQAVREFLELVAPMLRRLESLISDLPAYHPPEILPNGDIIIRRKRDDDKLRDPLENDEIDPDAQIKT